MALLCAEARQYGFATVCVNGFWVPVAAKELAGSEVKVCAVAGFPLGAMATAAKASEAMLALEQGANEIDMVLNIGALKAGDAVTAEGEIHIIAEACHSKGALVKVILETALLTDDEKRMACRLAVAAGADFVKTSTGFGPAGAKVEDVKLMRSEVGAKAGVKASGGIRTLADAKRMIEAGANRLGASASVNIIEATAAGS